MNTASPAPPMRGYFFGLAAYGLWGLAPLYFSALKQIAPLELLAHRILWSVLLLAPLLHCQSSFPLLLACLKQKKVFSLLLLSTLLIALNWFVYIYGVVNNQVLQTSLGYFLCPLVSVLLGRFVLKESLRRQQWWALLLAATGVGILMLRAEAFPWIALTLATSFACYGLVRKLANVEGVVGLSFETSFLLPFAAAYLGYLYCSERIQFASLGVGTDVLLLCSGAVTAVPLLCFGQAAKLLPLSTLGFLQYVSPSLQFLVAVYLLGESITTVQIVSFSFTWFGLLLFSRDTWLLYRKRRQMLRAENGFVVPPSRSWQHSETSKS